jgi:hypothetical protein
LAQTVQGRAHVALIVPEEQVCQVLADMLNWHPESKKGNRVFVISNWFKTTSFSSIEDAVANRPRSSLDKSMSPRIS